MKNKMWAYYMSITASRPKKFSLNDDGQCLKNFGRNVDEAEWDILAEALKNTGVNTVVIAVSDGVVYETHPEIALTDSWSKKRLSDEISKLRGMGFKVYPCVNFSAGHDEWMGVYSRMVSTPQYYAFCKDIIDEVCELFSNPELFHLGMDEECASIQKSQSISIIRNSELYWYDSNKLFKQVEKNGARPWIWADYVWHSPEREKDFLENMTKDVLLSNWYYQQFEHPAGDWHIPAYKAFELLEKHGYEQVPTGSNYVHRNNFELVVDHCVKHISDQNLKGFMIASWNGITKESHDHNMECVTVAGEVYNKYCNK